MRNAVIFQIAKTHLVSRKKQSIIASLGVTFGIGTFIILVSFMTGLNKMLDGLVIDRTPHVHIYNQILPSEQQPIEGLSSFSNAFNVINSIKPRRIQARIHNAIPIMNELKNNKEVLGVTPQVKAQVFYKSGSIEINGIIIGVDIIKEERLFNLGAYIIEGSAENLAHTENGIILGSGLAQKMSVKLGDLVQITTPLGTNMAVKIVGLFQSGLADIDNSQSYTNIKTTQKILNQSNNFITDINIKLKNLEISKEMAELIAKQFNVSAIDIKSANAQFETGTKIRNMITYAVSIALLIVAGFGIYNILNMLIYEKMNDIAILKATGFSGKDVRNIFMVQALIIGILGAILGLIIGYFVSVIIDNSPFETQALPTIKTFPVNFDYIFYVIGVVFAILTTFLAGYMPAKRASNIDPVDILRGQ